MRTYKVHNCTSGQTNQSVHAQKVKRNIHTISKTMLPKMLRRVNFGMYALKAPRTNVPMKKNAP